MRSIRTVGGRHGSGVWLKGIQTLEFLVENGKRLETFRPNHLGPKPCLDLVRLYRLQILMVVVKMAIEL
jgi:hypothetical protein